MSDTSKSQDTPIYAASGRRRSSGVYYGPAPYYGGAVPHQVAPAYYGGGAPYYGYGQPGYYGGGPAGVGDDAESLLGAVTIGRMLRVCSQRWMTIAVVAVLGAVAAFAVYRSLPSIYEAASTFEMMIRPPRIMRGDRAVIDEPTMGMTTSEEIYNTRLAKLRSWEVVQEVVHRFRADNPSSTITDEDLLKTLDEDTTLTLQRRTRLVRIGVRSTSADMAAMLANAYAQTVDSYSLEDSRAQSDSAVAWLKTTTEQQRRALARADQAILDFRVANQIDVMENDRKATQDAMGVLNGESVNLESRINRSRELVKVLEALQNDPDKFGALPESAPRSAELLSSYERLQTAKTESNVMSTKLTDLHPDYVAKKKEVEVLREQFADVVGRVRETAKSDLELLTREMQSITTRRSDLEKRNSELELSIVGAKMKLEALLREREVADLNFRNILQREQEARLSTDENVATIKVIEKAMPIRKPVSPNPYVVLPAGPIIGIILGIAFVLLLDHLEDKITGIPDIEHRIHLKVLAVLPHIRRARREQVAMLTAEDRFSHFAEAFAGLRNLVDSPRYAGVSKVVLLVSTQPGEGKTIASSNFALSCALSGQRTLLIDGDLRRPHLARIYGKTRKDYESLAHVLAANDAEAFARLPVPSGHANLDLVCTRSSSDISPSNVLGSGTISGFIEWARQNYDRVIIDSPPFGLVSDAVVLSALADGVIMLCCPDRTRFRPLKHAVRHLSEAGGHIIGVLVNDVDFGRAGMFSRYDYHYHYSYRYKYGYRYGYGQRGALPETAASAPAGGDSAAPAAPAAEGATAERQAVSAPAAQSRSPSRPAAPALDDDDE
jgi:capsular exopolysaccharide synthesis family protein